MKISEIADVKGGKRLPKGEELGSLPTNHPYIRAQDIREGKITIDDPKFLTREQHQRLKRYIVATGDVCIVIVGANVGDVGIVPERLHGANLTENAVKLTNFRHDYVPRYVNYCLSAPDAQAQMRQIAGGAAQPKLGIYKVLDVEIPFHPKNTQERIAAILSAYDDLIENNTRRIKILEEMAQMIYREWFVNFRFPGHEKVRMVESDLGPIPEGWDVKTLEELAHITMGQSPPSESYNSSGSGLPFHQGVTDFGTRFPVNRTYCTIENRLAEPHDILMSVRAPVGRLNISTKRIVIGRGLCSIRSKFDSQAILFQQLREHFREEDTMGSGTIFKAVTKQDVHGIKFIKADDKTAIEFEAWLKSLFRQLEILSSKNTNLRTTGDFLLPKLISGEISVEAADEAAAELVAEPA